MIDPVTELGNAADLGKPWDGPMLPEVPQGSGDRRCTKVAYDSKKTAETACNRALERRRNTPNGLHVYFCARCQAWHLGRDKRRAR